MFLSARVMILSFLILVVCSSCQRSTPTDQSSTSFETAASSDAQTKESLEEETAQASPKSSFFEIEELPMTEEHSLLVLRVKEGFEAPLHAEPVSGSPRTGSLSLSTEAVLSQAGSEVGNLAFERSLMRIPAKTYQARETFELDGVKVAKGGDYQFMPLYAGEGTFRFYYLIDGKLIELDDSPEAAIPDPSYDELYELSQNLIQQEDAQWWLYITLSADESGWFRADREELSMEMVEAPDW